MNAITFETINHSLNALDLEAPAHTAASLSKRVADTYKAVRPILVVVSVFPLVSPRGQQAVKAFLALLDQLTGTEVTTVLTTDPPTATGDFKAGKDI